MLDDRSSSVTTSVFPALSTTVTIKFAYLSISLEGTSLSVVKVSPKKLLPTVSPNIAAFTVLLIVSVALNSSSKVSPAFAYAGFALLLVNEIRVE